MYMYRPLHIIICICILPKNAQHTNLAELLFAMAKYVA